MKKTISIVLTLVFLLSFAQAQVSQAIDYGEVPEYKIGLLKAIDFIKDDGFAENDVLTRAEFCNMICRLFKYENYASSEIEFRDIDSSHPYYNSVSAVYAKGAIKGISKYSMAPNKSITLEEAGIIAVCALGYSPLVESGAASYDQKAAELGIFNGVSAPKGDGLTEEAAISIMYNILFAPIMNYLPDGNSISYSTNQNVLMMNEVYNMYESEGIVTENGVTSLYGESNISEDEIRLGDTVYRCGAEEASDLLGYAVKAYVVESDGSDDDTVVYAYADQRKSSDIEIMSEDIETAEKELIKYSVEDKTKKAKISKTADVIYNGIGIDSWDEEDIDPEYGKLKLVDNDGDDKYDVIFVTDYELFAVQNSLMNDKEIYIYDKDAKQLKVNAELVDCTVNVWINGQKKAFSDIKNGNVLLVADSGTRDTKRLINIYVLIEKVSGVLKSVSDEELVIDGTTVEYAPLLDESAAKEMVAKNVECYIDIYGKAVYLTTESVGKYGVLFKAAMLEDDNERVQVKIYESDNNWQTYLLKEKVRSNGKSIKDEDIYEQLTLQNDPEDESKGRYTVKQLVRYAVNDAGEISNLDIAIDTTDSRDRDKQLREAGCFRKSIGKLNRRYAHNTKGLFDGQGYSRWVECFFPSNMAVLVIPDSADFGEKDIAFYTGSYFQTDKDYVTEVYDLTEDNYSPVVVVYGDSSAQIVDGSPLVMVDHFQEELDEDELVVRKMYAWRNGVLEAFTPADEDSFKINGKEVKRGDLFRVALNFGGEVEYVEKNLTFSIDDNPQRWFTDKSSEGDNNAAHYRNQIVIGRVSEVNGDLLRVAVRDGECINAKLRAEASYLVYDDSNSKQVITKGSMNDLVVGNLVVARLYVGRLDQVFVFKNM